MPPPGRSKAAKKAAKSKTRRRRGIQIKPVSLPAADLPLPDLAGALRDIAEAVRADGGAVIGSYREPLGGRPLLLISVPIELVEPTPFQRDVSDAHVRKLTRAMDKTKRFLDPVILIRHHDRYYAPNGYHRLTAMKELGAHAIVGLLVPEPEVAYQILALNIEKAHNLKERALEVVRMYRDLEVADRKETDFQLEFEEPALITLGFAYEERGRFAGGAYHPAIRKVDTWIDRPFSRSVVERERRAGLVLGLDDAVNDVVERLKERGLVSPYLRAFVVARVNPLRFMKGELPGFDELLDTMTRRATRFNADRVQQEDLVRTGGAPEG
jgi:ParB family chromosome partitioning protein